jgi:glycosyltransferase involved in cell wall biosynthesis
MNIGMFITPNHTVPPDDPAIAAPWCIAGELSDELTRRGNVSVSLFAPRGSKTTAQLYDFDMPPTIRMVSSLPKEAYRQKEAADEALFFERMMRVGKEQNITLFHLHQSFRMHPLIVKAPKNFSFLITVHDPMTGKKRAAVEELSTFPNCFFVSITNAQRSDVQAEFAGTVYHGLVLGNFPFSNTIGSGFSVFGRIIPIKGQDDAIAVCSQIGAPLTIVGEVVQDTEENRNFWEQRIAPKIDASHVRYVPVLERKDLPAYYQHTKAILMPVKWEEPFGLVMIEAMACGTPVVAYNRGSVPEIVKDGITGFIIDPDDEDRPGKGTWIIKKQGIEGLGEAMKRIDDINRLACRKHVEEHFTVEHMATGYEQIYRKILKERSS